METLKALKVTRSLKDTQDKGYSIICPSLRCYDEDREKCVPTQTQVRENLGSKLSDVFFEQLCSEGRLWLGLEPPLIGPDRLWLSPDSRIEKKLRLSPVPEPAILHLKALTHQSVLEAGQICIVKLENKHRLHLENALERLREELEEEWRRKCGYGPVGGEQSDQTTSVVGTLMKHFDKCFEEFVELITLQMRKECRLRVEEERASIASYMLTQLQDEVERRDFELCNDFYEILYGELNTLARRYVKQINNERETAAYILQETIRKYEKMLQDMKVEMQLATVVDICQAITAERIECNKRISKIQNESKSNKEEIVELIKRLKEEKCTLQEMSNERVKRIAEYEKKNQVLLEEFQKFVNFALKTIPGQTEFLLSMEKLRIKNSPEDAIVHALDYQRFQKCLQGKTSDEEVHEKKFIGAEASKVVQQKSDSEISCASYRSRDSSECHLNFDYDEYKALLEKHFAASLPKKKKMKHKPKKDVCNVPKEGKKLKMKSKELQEILTLVGETERDHIVPVDTFLEDRLQAIKNISETDPEFVKLILGFMTDKK